MTRNVNQYIPEDKDQALVATPYGRGLVIRSQRPDGIREIQLTEWELASTTHRRRPNAVLYSLQSYPSVKPLQGDDVVCQWGRGRILEIRSDQSLVVELTSWKLANRCLVKCYLQPSQIQVVRKKTQAQMDVGERVQFATELKGQGNNEFAAKLFDSALLSYAKAVDAVRYLQHNSSSSNEIRADLLRVMITCCNNAATCCKELQEWDACINYAQNALVLLNALYDKRGRKVHSIFLNDGFTDVKIFGEWRIKSYLLIARAYLEKHDTEQTLKALSSATEVANLYLDDEKSTVTIKLQGKQIQTLYAHCLREQKMEKMMEKKRAVAMFGGPAAITNGSGSHDGNNNPPKATIMPNRSLNGAGTPNTPLTASDSTVREVEELPWYEEHKEALILTASAGVAILVGFLFRGRR